MHNDDFIRLIGLRLDNLTTENIKQISIFQSFDDNIKDEKLDKTLDELKNKYGTNIIKKAGSIKLKDRDNNGF